MKKIWFKFPIVVLIVIAVGAAMFISPGQVSARGEAQSGVIATVIYSETINVRGGPSTVYYPIVGSANPGDELLALGVSPGREWVKVSFPSAPGGVGWVYATFVSISGDLQVVEPPPTQTPIATATVNPTFAAAFIFQPTSTRMPTFTPPPPLTVPNYTDEVTPRASGLASGVIVVSLLLISALVFFVSHILNRQ